MKRIVTLGLVAAALVGTASSASADRWRHRGERVTVIERSGPDLNVVVQGLLLGQLMNGLVREQPIYEEPVRPFAAQPKLDPFRPAPLK